MRAFIFNFQRWLRGGLLLTLVMTTALAFSQTTQSIRRFTVGGNALQITPQPTQLPNQVAPDAFDSMINSAASFDMDSPVVATAEFDPPVAVVGGRVVFRLTVSALDESLSAPPKLGQSNGLELSAGGRGQTYEMTGNQKMRPMTTVIYHVTVTNVGAVKIPSFEILAYGKPVKVPESTLTVLPAGSPAPGEVPRLFVDLPPGDCYVGQLLKVMLVMPLSKENRILGGSQPHINGEFIFSEQFPFASSTGPIERGGEMVNASVSGVMITPLRAGAQEIIGQMRGVYLRPNATQPTMMDVVNQLIDSDPVTLNVLPLPTTGVLPGFTGAVGSFQLDTPRLSTNQVRAGEPVTLTFILRGDGNMGRLTPPPAPALREWEAFPPVSENTPPSVMLQRGFATFSYTLIPLEAQIQATPPIPFSYFDPVRKMYVDLTIPPVSLTVLPAPVSAIPKTAADSAAPSASLEDPATSEKEPVFMGLVETPGVTAHNLAPVQQHWWFYILQLVPAAFIAGLWGWDRRVRFLEQHPEVILKRRARRGLKRQLRLARQAVRARDAEGFATAATDALREACAPHSASDPGALVCADVLQELPLAEQQGRPGEMIRRLFAATDALRFGGPTQDNSRLLDTQPDLEQVLEELRGRL